MNLIKCLGQRLLKADRFIYTDNKCMLILKENVMRCTLGLLLIIFPLSIGATTDPDREEIEQRIKPIGRVHIEKPKTQMAISAPEAPAISAPAGQVIYEQRCMVCHRDGVAGAPKFRDEASWKARLAGRDIDALVASAIKGKNAMPPKGTCQECSDSDIKVAIEYMVPQK